MEFAIFTLASPYPTLNGMKQRNYHLITRLAEKGHRIHLVSVLDHRAEIANLEHMRQYCSTITYGFRKGATGRNYVRALRSPKPFHVWDCFDPDLYDKSRHLFAENAIDVAVTSLMYFAEYMPFDDTSTLYVCDALDSDRDVWRQQYRGHPQWRRRLYSYINYLKTCRYENRVYPKFDLVVHVSQVDVETSRREVRGRTDYAVVTCGADTDHCRPAWDTPDEGYLLFLGSGNYKNIAALHWFCDEVLPLILKERKDTELHIVGNVDKSQLGRLVDRPGVMFFGRVDDVRPHYHKAAVVVAPFTLGGGVKVKVFEALAFGKAVVSTSVGLQGIDLENGKNVIVADDREHFAREVAGLLGAPDRRRELGRAARATAVEKYDWTMLMDEMEKVILEHRHRKQGGSRSRTINQENR